MVVLDAVSWKRSPQKTLRKAIAYVGWVRHRCALLQKAPEMLGFVK
ncbi:hypothetical protein [uncultured Nostoc sp.]